MSVQLGQPVWILFSVAGSGMTTGVAFDELSNESDIEAHGGRKKDG